MAGFAAASTTMQQHGELSTASVTMKAGFTSVASRYDELMEQARLKVLDKRSGKDETTEKTKGLKRQGDAKGSIANFFKKPCTQPAQAQAVAARHEDTSRTAYEPSTLPEGPLLDMTNIQSRTTMGASRVSQSSYKPLAVPLKTRPAGSLAADRRQSDKSYVFLSSSPPHAEDGENGNTDTAEPVIPAEKPSEPKQRPAATFHTTSMQTVAPQRRTLGMRRSVQGWTPRNTGT